MLIVIAIAVFLIGFSKAGVGGTLSPFVTVLVALSLPADDTIGLLLPMLIVADWFTITAHWRQWVTPIVLRLLVASSIGIALGSTILGNISEPALRNLIAIAMLVFAVYYLITKTQVAAHLAMTRAWPAGLLAGVQLVDSPPRRATHPCLSTHDRSATTQVRRHFGRVVHDHQSPEGARLLLRGACSMAN